MLDPFKRAKKEINALKLLSLKKTLQKVVTRPPSNLLIYTTNKEAHKQNEFRRRHKMFKTVPSLQARPLN